jgi:hypothetical protein
MSKLTEAMQLIEPLARANQWSGNQWRGDGNPHEIASTVLNDMAEVDTLMREIARATSLPTDEDERVARAVDVAVVEMRQLDPTDWPGRIIRMLEELASFTSETDFQTVLMSLRDRITARLDGGGW